MWKFFKKLQKEDLVKNNKVVIAANAKAWANNDIIKDWINQVYVSYFKNPLEKTLFIWDNITMKEKYSYFKIFK